MVPDSMVDVLAIAAHIVFFASILNLFMPPYEVFNDFPNAQRYYKLIIAIVGNIAMSGRSKLVQLYPSVKNGNGETKTDGTKK